MTTEKYMCRSAGRVLTRRLQNLLQHNPGVVAHACHPALERCWQQDPEFKLILRNLASLKTAFRNLRTCVKRKKEGGNRGGMEGKREGRDLKFPEA